MDTSPEQFNAFCNLCDNLKKASKHAEKDELLTKYINNYKKWDEENITIIPNQKSSTYPVIRLLIPEFERERGPYGLKETAFAKILINAFCLHGHEANKLSNFKSTTNSKKGEDFADVVFWTLKRRCASTSKLTIEDVNKFLDNLALQHSEHRPIRDIERSIYTLTKSATAINLKWIIRIILKDMKLGMGNNRILKNLHPDAPDLYDVCSDLSKVCIDLNDSSRRLHELEISVFTPFRPMLSLKCDKIVLDAEVTDDRLFYVENKFDGERFQLHMRDHVYKYYSKNGYEYTNTYGETYDSAGLITPHLKDMFKSVHSIILDGEMMGWNTKTKTFGSKGMSYDVKNLRNDSVHRPCFCVFDILLYNDRILTNEPLKQRIKIIEDLIFDIKGVIIKSKITQTLSKEILLHELNKSVENQEEGICFKDPHSIYKPNNRKAGWWKLKLEYFDGVMTELDAIIIGGYYGEGKRRGLISSFLLAVAVTPDDPSTSPSTFHSFAKVANGFTIEELDKLIGKMKSHFKPVNKNEMPDGIIWKKEKPDVWIHPRHSYILQIKASELAKSSEFETEYTLRFPRVEKIRYDKPWYNCMTTTELEQLTKSSKPVEKLNNRLITTDDVQVLPKKRKMNNFFDVHVPTIEADQKKSNLFNNKEIRILTGNDQYSVEDLEIKVLEHGGKLVKIDGPNNFCVVVGDITTAVGICQRNSPRDIVTVEWFLRAIEHSTEKLLEWEPDDLINMSKKTKQKLSNYYDKYGDSYVEPITREKLTKIFKRIDEQGDQKQLLPEEIIEFDEIISFTNPLGLFRNCYIYFDVNPDDNINNISLRNIKNEFIFYGGTICTEVEEKTTNIMVHSKATRRIEDLKEEYKSHMSHIAFINEKWIQASISAGIQINNKMYCIEK